MPHFATPGEILREARLAKGWSQVELARRLGLPQGNLSAMERGVHGRRYRLDWYLDPERRAVWEELDIDVADLAKAVSPAEDGVCPCCKRPF